MVGTLADALNSDVVKLSIAGSEFVTIYDLEYTTEPPRNRISTRAGKLDTYGPELEDLWASLTVDKATFNLIVTATTPNSRRKYTAQAIVITGQALSGSGDDITISFSAEIISKKLLAPQGGLATTLRIHMIGL